MKNFIINRRFFINSAILLSVFAGLATARAQTKVLRVGVYDSRAIAVAFANSAEFRDTFLKPARRDHEQARAAKDDKKMKDIESRMQLTQRRLHEEGFSTGSVASIMARVKTSLPTVAKEAGVDLIVSKWEMNYQSPDVAVTDVTDKLVALFHTSEKGQKWAAEIQKQPPIPIEELGDDVD